MARYRRDVSRDRYPVGLGGDPKNFGIGGAVRDPPLRRRENLLPVPAAAILGRSRGLGRRRPGNEGSSLLLCPFALPSLKTFDHAGREGVAGFDLFVATILIFEICLDFFWMLQDKRNCAVDLGQRSDRRVGIKDRFGRPPIPKIVCNHVKSNSGSGDVVSTVPSFHILVGRHHGDSTYSLLQPALALIVRGTAERGYARHRRCPAPSASLWRGASTDPNPQR